MILDSFDDGSDDGHACFFLMFECSTPDDRGDTMMVDGFDNGHACFESSMSDDRKRFLKSNTMIVDGFDGGSDDGHACFEC